MGRADARAGPGPGALALGRAGHAGGGRRRHLGQRRRRGAAAPPGRPAARARRPRPRAGGARLARPFARPGGAGAARPRAQPGPGRPQRAGAELDALGPGGRPVDRAARPPLARRDRHRGAPGAGHRLAGAGAAAPRRGAAGRGRGGPRGGRGGPLGVERGAEHGPGLHAGLAGAGGGRPARPGRAERPGERGDLSVGPERRRPGRPRMAGGAPPAGPALVGHGGAARRHRRRADGVPRPAARAGVPQAAGGAWMCESE
jgi:hypothetical protein